MTFPLIRKSIVNTCPHAFFGVIYHPVFQHLHLLNCWTQQKKAEKLIQIVLKSYIFPRSAFSSQKDELFISLPISAWASRVGISHVGILSFGRIIVSIASPYCWCNGPRVQYLPIYGESLLLPDFLSEQHLILSRIGKKYSFDYLHIFSWTKRLSSYLLN